MEMGVVSRVGLQLLLEPSSTAFAFRAASLATGCLYPAYATYKAVQAPKRAAAAAAAAGGRHSPTAAAAAVSGSLAAERWLKYWAIFGLATLIERAGEGLLERFPYYYHAKFGLLLWLQLHQGQGGALLFDGWLAPHVARYERKIDTLLEVGAQLVEMFVATYAGPLAAARAGLTTGLAQLATFLKWLSTPDDVTDGAPRSPTAVPPGGCGSSGAVGDGSSVRGRHRWQQQ